MTSLMTRFKTGLLTCCCLFLFHFNLYADPINTGVAVHYQANPFLEATFANPPKNIRLASGFASSFQKVYLSAPHNFNNKFSESGNIALAKNEYESVQLVLFPFQNIDAVDIKLSEFKHDNGNTIFNAAHIRLRPVGYVSQIATRFPANRKGWHPDPLFPQQQLQLTKSQPQSILLTVYTPHDSLAGNYHGKISIYQHNKLLTQLSLNIKVWNFTLPNKSRFKSSNFNTYSRIKSMWPGIMEKAGPGQKIIQQQFLKVASLAAQNRLPSSGFIVNGLNSWNNKNHGDTSMAWPTHENVNGKWQLDTDNLDYLFSILARQFTNHFFTAFTFNLHQPEESYAKRKRILEYYLDDYLAYLKKHHLQKNAYIYNIDEPWGDRIETVKAQYKMLKSIVGDDIKVMQNTNQNNNKIIGELLGHFDVLDINLGFYHVTELEKYRRHYPEKLKEVWWNLNLWPSTRPNLFIEYPLIDARIIGPMSYKYNMQGFEYWELFHADGYKHYRPADKLNLKLDWQANAQSLDGNLVYPTDDMDVLSSLRLEALRDGFEDQEYLYLLALHHPGHVLLHVPLVKDIFDFEQSPQQYLAFRQQLAEAILKPH